MDPTKLIIEHPFSIEEKFKKADLEKMFMKKDGICYGSIKFAYKEGGVAYRIWLTKSTVVPDGKIVICFYVNLGNVGEVQAKKLRFSLPSINYSIDFDSIFKESGAAAFVVTEKTYSRTGFFVNDELDFKFDGTLIFERPLITTTSIPINIRWNIKESQLKEKVATNEFLKSPEFTISPNFSSKYCLVIYPNGCCVEMRGNVVTYLDVYHENDEKIEVYHTWSLGSLSHNIYTKNEKEEVTGIVLCPTAELFCPSKKFFVNGEMTLKSKETFIIKKEEPLIQLSGMPFKGFKNEKDFKLIVDGKDIQVHKSLLIEKSLYFAKILNSKESTKNEILLSGFSFKTVDAAIKLLYGISSTLSLSDLIPLLYFSDKYIITDIKTLVENQLMKNICESNVCQLIHFSTIFHAPKLYQNCLQFLLKCLRKSSPVNDMDLLDKDLCLQLLSKTFYQVCD